MLAGQTFCITRNLFPSPATAGAVAVGGVFAICVLWVHPASKARNAIKLVLRVALRVILVVLQLLAECTTQIEAVKSKNFRSFVQNFLTAALLHAYSGHNLKNFQLKPRS